jgi:hypothetical protein
MAKSGPRELMQFHRQELEREQMTPQQAAAEGIDVDRGAEKVAAILACNQVLGTKPCTKIGQHSLHITADGEEWMARGSAEIAASEGTPAPTRKRRADAGKPREPKPAPEPPQAQAGKMTRGQNETLRSLFLGLSRAQSDQREAEYQHAADVKAASDALHEFLESITAQ